MKAFLLWLKTAFEETPGVASSMRILLTLGILDVLTVWTVASCRAGKPVALDWSVVSLIGLLVGGKVTQHFSETDTKT